jgi:uncharacterized DUF497 family protein
VHSNEEDVHFCWNEEKAAANLEKHGVSFEAASYVFDDPMQLDRADVFAAGEHRSIVVGRVDGVLLTVVYSSPEEGLFRIISARTATPYERRTYERNFFQA